MTCTQAKTLIRHWRGQLEMECDNTAAAIRTIVWLTARAEAAEAKLAAVPIMEIRTVLRAAVDIFDMPDRVDLRVVKRWLAQQEEVQP